MLEIYYTSAPEGLKRGSSGFCTVAASNNIAKPVLERLEALSGYRHHFAQGQGQQNPVSHAHWRLSAGGKEYHVLSRVCDSGVDHTHRTNAFAHHIALEGSELPQAGPAAVLGDSRAMTSTWDGNVGALTRTTLPTVHGQGNGPCRAWAAAAGDAGYAGLLLEAAIKTPNKQVCILFNPGQDMLPLIEEVMGLLPAPIRWAVTFNTYFTSMPTSAVCAWRCCLARTPAADAAARSAAGGGIIINLADLSKLPALPDNAYVAAARNGSTLTAGAAPAVAKSIGAKPAKTPAKGKQPGKGDDIELQEEIALAVEKYGAKVPGGGPGTSNVGLDVDEAPLPSLELTPVELSEEGGSQSTAGSAPIRNVEALLQRAEGHAAKARKRRKTQMMVMYSVAAAFVVIVSLLVIFAMNMNDKAEKDEAIVSHKLKPQTAPAVAPEPEAVAQTAPVETQPELPDPTPIVKVETKPAEVVPATIPVVKEARTIITEQFLQNPQSLAQGIGERVQLFKLTGDDADDFHRTTSLAVAFPGGAPEYHYDTPTLAGVFSTTINSRNSLPSIIIEWKDSNALGGPVKIATLTFTPNRNQLDVIWSSAAVMNKDKVEIVEIAYWVLTQSQIIGVDASGPKPRAQRLAFKPAVIPPITLSEDPIAFKPPSDLPTGTKAVIEGELAKGWSGSFFADWESKDPGQRTEDNKIWIAKMRCATSSKAVDAFFTISFHNRLTSIETDWYKRMASDEVDLKKAEQELTDAEGECSRISDTYTPDIERLEKLRTDYEARVKNPAAEGMTPAQASEALRLAKVSIDNKRKAMDKELVKPLAKKIEKEAFAKPLREQQDAYKALDTIDVTFKLPNDLTIFTLRLKKK